MIIGWCEITVVDRVAVNDFWIPSIDMLDYWTECRIFC